MEMFRQTQMKLSNQINQFPIYNENNLGKSVYLYIPVWLYVKRVFFKKKPRKAMTKPYDGTSIVDFDETEC